MKSKYLIIMLLLMSIIVACNDDDNVVSVDDPIITNDTTEVQFKLTKFDSLRYCKNNPIALYGKGFGVDSNNLQVYFKDLQLPVLDINDTILYVLSPNISGEGTVSIIKNNIKTELEETVTILDNECFELDKNEFEIWQGVTYLEVKSNGFLKYIDMLTFNIGGVEIDYNIMDDNLIELYLPKFISGDYIINLNLFNHKWKSVSLKIKPSEENNFEIQEFNPGIVKIGDTVTIIGDGFGTEKTNITLLCETEDSGDIKYIFREVEIENLNDTELTFIVPDWCNVKTYLRLVRGGITETTTDRLLIDKGNYAYTNFHLNLSNLMYEAQKKGIDNNKEIDTTRYFTYDYINKVWIKDLIQESKLDYSAKPSENSSLSISFNIDTINHKINDFHFSIYNYSKYVQNHQSNTVTSQILVDWVINELEYTIDDNEMVIIITKDNVKKDDWEFELDQYYQSIYTGTIPYDYDVNSTGNLEFNDNFKLEITLTKW